MKWKLDNNFVSLITFAAHDELNINIIKISSALFFIFCAHHIILKIYMYWNYQFDFEAFRLPWTLQLLQSFVQNTVQSKPWDSWTNLGGAG